MPRIVHQLIALLAAIACIGASEPTPHPLPSHSDFEQLVRLAELTPRAFADGVASGELRADACTWKAGELSCECVLGTIDGNRVRIGELTAADADGASLVDVWFQTDDDTLWHAADMTTQSGEDVASGSYFRDGRFLTFVSARVGAERVILDHVRFGTGQVSLDWDSCAAPDRSRLQTRARAVELRLEDGTWSIPAYLRGGFQTTALDSDDGGASGLLGPGVRYAPGIIELDASGYVAPLSTAIVASIAPDEFYGGGIALVTEAGDGAVEWLDVQARWNADDARVRPFVNGDFSLGVQQIELAGHLEHPASEASWAARRLESGAFFRGFRASDFGVSLSGDAHTLTLYGAVVSDAADADGFHGRARFAATRELGAGFRGDLDVAHATFVRFDALHSTTAIATVDRPIGRAGRAHVVPRLRTLANSSVIPAGRGFSSATAAQIMAELDAGLALEGRFEQSRHYVAPRMKIGTELVGLQERPTDGRNEDLPFRRRERWTYGAAWLEQSLGGDAFQIAFPVGVFGQWWTGLDEPDLDLFGRVELSDGDRGFHVGASCFEECGAPDFTVGGHTRVARRLEASYTFSNAGAGGLRRVFVDRALASPSGTVALSQPQLEPGSTTAHSAALHWRGRYARTGVAGHFTPTRPETSGLTGRLAYVIDTIGWGLGATAGYIPASGDFALTFGIETTGR